MSDPIIRIEGLDKIYAGKSGSGKEDVGSFQALRQVDLSIERGEIFALLGPNGAGKTTLISVVCGLASPTRGTVWVDGFDNVKQYRDARERIGLVPQELTNEAFETVWNTVSFSRGLFGKPPNPEHIERVLKSLTLWDKRHNRLMTLSGGMKRRVLIAKALSHEPRILFLDEPTAGVDVELRREMWEVVRELRDQGVTIILTTHYIEEAEEMADRIGVINNGEVILVEETNALIEKLGRKQLTLQLFDPLDSIPDSLATFELALSDTGEELIYSYESSSKQRDSSGISTLLRALEAAGIGVKDLHTRQSSLEDIFVDLVKERA
ncbi:ABC transporter ATP-binding protein [Halomonas sp. CH40]